LFFRENEVLVAAQQLMKGDTIHRQLKPQVDDDHILLENHEIILPEGVSTESFFPGRNTLLTEAAMRAELLTLFPELSTVSGRGDRKTA